MAGNPQVLGLLEEILDSGRTPEEVCRNCPDLLPEVRRRWQEFRRIDAQLGALLPGLHTRPDEGAATPAPPAASLPQIPGYDVEAMLGCGGMGVVYKARQRALDRLVAVKMLLAGPFAGPQELVRFRQETAALACLRHPNIVQVYDAGDVEGRPYFSMELIEGGSLAQKLAGTPQPARQAAELLATLAEAVEAAHACGIVHRDLKPGNVLLAADGTPKITDFGLARRLEGGGGLTLSGAPLGTPSYMAPEQARGDKGAIGLATDVYALGAILYELLTGRPPFRSETAAATLQQVLAEDPAPPARLNAKTPRDLETICLKCLHKTPAYRYPTAQELVEDLHRFLEGKPIRARPVGAVERAVKWARRRPAAALLVAALLVLAAAAAGAGLWLRQQEEDRQAAKAKREGQARESVSTALARAGDLRAAERWEEARIVLTEASGRLAEADSPELKERLARELSNVQFAADLEGVREMGPLEPTDFICYRKRAADFRDAFERGGLRIGDDAGAVADAVRTSAIRDQLTAALDDWALAAFMINDDPSAKRLLRIAQSADPEPGWGDRFRDHTIWHDREQLVRLAADAFDASPAPPGRQLALLGLLLRRAGAWSESTRLLGEACRRRPDDFWLDRELGSALSIEGYHLESAGYYRAALALRPDNAAAYRGLGVALFEAGRTDDALAAYRRMVELAPAGHSTHGYYVDALARAGRWVEAAAECRRALDADPTDNSPPLRLALALYNDQRDEDAISLFRQAIGAGFTDDTAYYYLGLACGRANRHDEAVAALRKEVEAAPRVRITYPLLARELDAVGRPEEAIAALQTGIDEWPTDATLRSDLGASLRARGRPVEAAAAFRKAADLDPQLAAAWDGLAESLLDRGDFAGARAATDRLLHLPSAEAAQRARRRLDLCDALIPLDAHLPAILAGKERPGKVAAQLALAEWCLKHRRLTAAAAGFYEAALAADPPVADDLEAGHRYNAARAAAAAGCGIGEDAAGLDGQRRAALREEALGWLTADYDAWAARHRLGRPGDRTFVATAVRAWRQDDDLAGVRDEPALDRLPPDERQAWQKLWADVGTLSARDPAALFDQARAHVGRREWKEAVACYAEGLELETTDNGELWFEYAAVQLLADDRAGYRRACTHMLACCQPKGPIRPYLVARACTLAPNSADDPAEPARLALDELSGNRNACWSLTERGALAVRAGQFDQTVPLLERSLAADGRPGRAVLDWLWLALAYQKMGSPKEARQQLAKAVAWLDQQGGRMPHETIPMGSHRHNWLEAQVLLQEAKTLLP
jgi:serine/threonine-protein kinase